MVIRFSGIVQESGGQEPVLTITPRAGIDTISLHDNTFISYTGGGTAHWQAIRPGMQIQVSGLDDGGNRLRAQHLIISNEAPVPQSDVGRAPAPRRHTSRLVQAARELASKINRYPQPTFCSK